MMKCVNRKKNKFAKLTRIIFVGFVLFVSYSIWANNSANNFAANVFSSNIDNNKNIHKVFNNGSPVRVKMLAGSVRANIERVARMYGWKTIIWRSNEDYNWHGTSIIKGSSLSNVMEKILSSYPLQANFYYGNRVLVIKARTLKNEER